MPLCLTSWEKNPNKSAKTAGKKMVYLHKSGSSLGAISKCLKVPHSSVQTIVSKYKHHGTTQPSYHSERRRVLSPRDEHTLAQKVQINPRTAAKDLVKMLEETSPQVSISTVKQLFQHTRKATQQGRSHCSKTTIRKPDYGLQLHMGSKIVLFGEMSPGLMKQK
uniref:Sleeping Beauty transposase HTH domain-containing protein n=1 Tax=Oncorhynchus tshawytscha TaxID=74940 RepID=A0AAZ3R372_ONCTS